MTSAFKVSDRIVMLSNGQIRATGTPEQIRTSEDPEVRRFIDGRASEEDLRALKRIREDHHLAETSEATYESLEQP